MGRQRKKTAANSIANGLGTVRTAQTSLSRPSDRRGRRGHGGLRRNPDHFDPPPHRPAGAAALALPVRPLVPAVANPRMLDGSPLILPPRIGTIDEHFLSTELPAMNNAVSCGTLTVADFAEALQRRLAKADLEALCRIADRLSPMAALYVLSVLGAIASSAVRHIRVATGDSESSAGLELVPGLESALVRFGNVTERSPRDNHDTTWVLNFPVTFTATEGELRFGRAVREANRLLGASNALLMPVRTGEVGFVEAIERFAEATAHVKAYTLIQSDLAFNSFSKDFFAMRKFLGAYMVAGKRLEGPNATYTGGWCSFELSVGLLDNFRETALHRTSYMSTADRLHIETSCKLPTIAEITATHLGVTEPDLERLNVDMLSGRLTKTAPNIRQAIVAARGLMKANAQLAATHVGAIQKNLVIPASLMTDAERAHLGVSPDGGVSGTPLEHTFDQRTRRMLHPLVRMAVASMKEDTK